MRNAPLIYDSLWKQSHNFAFYLAMSNLEVNRGRIVCPLKGRSLSVLRWTKCLKSAQSADRNHYMLSADGPSCTCIMHADRAVRKLTHAASTEQQKSRVLSGAQSSCLACRQVLRSQTEGRDATVGMCKWPRQVLIALQGDLGFRHPGCHVAQLSTSAL